MERLNDDFAARERSPLRTRAGRAMPRARRNSSETGFRAYRSGRQMREAVTAVVQASRWVRHDTPGF
ncbi:MAG: hypothetical protein JJE27_02905 [Thermoleophilia bacterium]|nr:hypothetical protein [Thermoleophilia bacterium]